LGSGIEIYSNMMLKHSADLTKPKYLTILSCYIVSVVRSISASNSRFLRLDS
jgi:hypothetical protein